MATGSINNSQSYIIHSQRITESGSGTSKSTNVTADSIEGYTPVGIVGWCEHVNGAVHYYTLYIQNNKIYYAWNSGTTSVSDHSFTVYVLYKRQ